MFFFFWNPPPSQKILTTVSDCEQILKLRNLEVKKNFVFPILFNKTTSRGPE